MPSLPQSTSPYGFIHDTPIRLQECSLGETELYLYNHQSYNLSHTHTHTHTHTLTLFSSFYTGVHLLYLLYQGESSSELKHLLVHVSSISMLLISENGEITTATQCISEFTWGAESVCNCNTLQ